MIRNTLVISLALWIAPLLVQPSVIHDGIEIKQFEPIVAEIEPRQEIALIKPVSVSKPSLPSGSWIDQCHAWALQAGFTLPESAIKLINRESKCSPTVRNPNSSAGGIPQALPWTKMGCPLSNEGAVCQLKWMRDYVFGRYGSWESALSHSYAKGWY